MKRITLILSMMIALIGLNANAEMYIVGSGIFGDQNGDWDPNGGMEMTLTEDNVYTCTANIDGAVWFVFADGRDSNWDTFNMSYRYGPTSGNDETVVVDNEYQTQRSYGSFGAYKFVGSGEDYVFTINPTTLKFSISGYVAPIEVTTYSVVGNFNGWNVNSADDIMTLVNGVYTLNRQHVELQAGTLQYKFIGNHDYGISQEYSPNEHGRPTRPFVQIGQRCCQYQQPRHPPRHPFGHRITSGLLQLRHDE